MFPNRVLQILCCFRTVIYMIIIRQPKKIIKSVDRLTKGHFRKEMVNHVVMSHIVQEKASLPSQEITINSASSPSLIGPLSFAEMRQLGIGVMKIRNHNKLAGKVNNNHSKNVLGELTQCVTASHGTP